MLSLDGCVVAFDAVRAALPLLNQIYDSPSRTKLPVIILWCKMVPVYF